MTAARFHALERTSPKGGPFFGTCLQCGRSNLPISAYREKCENVSRLSEEEALLLVLSPPQSMS
jgi:uncharacterized OB-fold protein